MVRHIAAVLVALFIGPSWLTAQTTMTVTVPSADVYLSPSTGSPVIGSAPKGTVLAVTRELGSWVKVAWPDARNGVGYVHVSKGTIAGGSPTGDRAVASVSPSAQPATRRVPTTVPGAASAASGEQPVLLNPMYVAPPSHAVGVGGLLAGPNAGFGASARAWRHDRLGIQFDVSRYALTGVAAAGRVTSIEFEPSVLYSMPDHVTDYWWLRPYIGSGLSVQRQTFTSGTAGTVAPVSDSRAGFHVFGGGEVAFASMPRFAVGVDVSYRWLSTPFAGFETDRLGIAVSGRWYVR
ncbi:MAG: SH3 domain-containing protein [Betaproteobacteria bacterium]